jgi:hypothetical protein
MEFLISLIERSGSKVESKYEKEFFICFPREEFSWWFEVSMQNGKKVSGSHNFIFTAVYLLFN